MSSILEPYRSKREPNETGTTSIYASVNNRSFLSPAIDNGGGGSGGGGGGNDTDISQLEAKVEALEQGQTTQDNQISSIQTTLSSLDPSALTVASTPTISLQLSPTSSAPTYPTLELIGQSPAGSTYKPFRIQSFANTHDMMKTYTADLYCTWLYLNSNVSNGGRYSISFPSNNPIKGFATSTALTSSDTFTTSDEVVSSCAYVNALIDQKIANLSPSSPSNSALQSGDAYLFSGTTDLQVNTTYVKSNFIPIKDFNNLFLTFYLYCSSSTADTFKADIKVEVYGFHDMESHNQGITTAPDHYYPMLSITQNGNGNMFLASHMFTGSISCQNTNTESINYIQLWFTASTADNLYTLNALAESYISYIGDIK